jgi:hypothetical protein
MPAQTLDTRNVLRGYDGELYDGESNFLAQVNTFQAQINITNSDYQAAGQALVAAVPQSYTVTLTFTETVIYDAVLLKKLLDKLKDSDVPLLNFQGVLRARKKGASDGRYAFRDVVPDGAIDIANVAPGDVLNRAWSWRVNQVPDLQAVLGS